MVLYLLRHADAVDASAGLPDWDRPLTEKGIQQARRVGQFCLRENLIPDVIVSSPLARAQSTAELVATELELDVQVEGFLASGMRPETALEELRGMGRSAGVMLVGHEPDLSDLIATLLGLRSPGNLRIRKASLTGIEVAHPSAGGGVLQFSLPSTLMR
jgi:phosphohistidine phosphatase